MPITLYMSDPAPHCLQVVALSARTKSYLPFEGDAYSAFDLLGFAQSIASHDDTDYDSLPGKPQTLNSNPWILNVTSRRQCLEPKTLRGPTSTPKSFSDGFLNPSPYTLHPAGPIELSYERLPWNWKSDLRKSTPHMMSIIAFIAFLLL